MLIAGTSHAAAPRTELPHAVAFVVPKVLVLPVAQDGADADLVAHKRVLAANPAPTQSPAVAPASILQPRPAAPRKQRGEQVRTRKTKATRAARPATRRVQRGAARPAVQQVALTSTSPVIAFALAQVGKPYRWAAAGPNAFDCSGLVLAAYARAGVRLPHQTGSMIRYGTPVARSQLQPGDIVFPSSSHVAIYLGGGKIVHAPKPGDHVRVAPLYSFWAARRL